MNLGGEELAHAVAKERLVATIVAWASARPQGGDPATRSTYDHLSGQLALLQELQAGRNIEAAAALRIAGRLLEAFEALKKEGKNNVTVVDTP